MPTIEVLPNIVSAPPERAHIPMPVTGNVINVLYLSAQSDFSVASISNSTSGESSDDLRRRRIRRLRQRAALRASTMPSYDDPPEYAQLLAESNAELFELQLHSRALSNED